MRGTTVIESNPFLIGGAKPPDNPALEYKEGWYPKRSLTYQAAPIFRRFRAGRCDPSQTPTTND